MMVSVADGVQLEAFVNILKLKTSSFDERKNAYQSITGFMKDGDSDRFDAFLYEVTSQLSTLIDCICSDVSKGPVELSQHALHTLGFCLFQDDVTRHLSEEQCETITRVLCDVINDTTDKNTCTRALWCIAKQTLNTHVLSKHVEMLVEAIEQGQCKKNFKSMTVEHEALNAIVRLLEQVADAMKPHAAVWGRLVYPLLVHSAPIVRERALVAMELGLPAMMTQQSVLAPGLASDLRALLIREMTKLFDSGHEAASLLVWRYYTKLLGRVLHHGSLINQMLVIVEKGFKNPSARVKESAYQAWKALIDNFSLSLDILSDQRRVKLLMQVFKLSNAKYEQVASMKLATWWHFVVRLREKAPIHFDQVCVPLLNFCVAGSVNSTSLTPTARNRSAFGKLGTPSFGSPSTPKLNVSNQASPSGAPVFKSVQLKGVEVIGQFLNQSGTDIEIPDYEYSIEKLEDDAMHGVTFFAKHSAVLIGAVAQSFITLGTSIPDGLVAHVWFSTVAHVRAVVDHTSKKDHTDCLSLFLTSFKDIVDSQCFTPDVAMRLFSAVLLLPDKVLSSLSYPIGGVSVLTQGSPALYLIEVLFNHRLVETCALQPNFQEAFVRLVQCGFTVETAGLGFCQSVVSLLTDRAASFESPEALWAMWFSLSSSLLCLINKTNEVNQGNSLESDFSCLIDNLSFPLLYILKPGLKQSTMKSLVKHWGELYLAFNRLVAMEVTTEANTACQQLCHNIVAKLPTPSFMTTEVLEGTIQISEVMVKALEFSGSTQSNQLFLGVKASFGKNTPNLGNFTALCCLLKKQLESMNQLTRTGQGPAVGAQAVLATLGMLSTLFTHVPSASLLVAMATLWSEALAEVMTGAVVKVVTGKTFTNQFFQKVEKLWIDITTSFQGCYKGPYDTDFLATIAPILATSFVHSRRGVKNQTLMFWNATFARSDSLVYPGCLKPVLTKVKARTPVTLPGWCGPEVGHVEDTPASQLTQGESQVPLPEIVAMTSPRKEFGSFLNKKPLSPNIKVSPLKPVTSPVPAKKTPSAAHARKKLSLNMIDDMSSKDFVVIASPPRKKRVLTEHQKEVMRERRADIPALYSHADTTRDAMRDDTTQDATRDAFTADTQDASLPAVTATPEVSITPFPYEKPAPGADHGAVKEDSELLLADKKHPIKRIHKKKESAEKREMRSKPAMTTRRRSVRFSDEIDLESLPSHHGNESLPDLGQSDNGEKSRDTGKPEETQKHSKRTAEDHSVVVIESQDDSETQHVTPVKERRITVDSEEQESGQREMSSAGDRVKADDSTHHGGASSSVREATVGEAPDAGSVSEKEPGGHSLSDNIAHGHSLPENIAPGHSLPDNIVPGHSVSDNIAPNDEQASVGFDDQPTQSEKQGSEEMQNGAKETEKSSADMRDAFLERFSPASQDSATRRRTRSQSPRGSPMRKVTSLTSPRKRTPTKKQGWAEKGTLDTWLSNSKKVDSIPNQTTQNNVVEESESVGQMLSVGERNAASFCILGDDVSPVAKKAAENLVVMAEDTQQFSPAKMESARQSTSADVIVDETPVKEQENARNVDSANASRNLTDSLETNNVLEGKDIPESEMTTPAERPVSVVTSGLPRPTMAESGSTAVPASVDISSEPMVKLCKLTTPEILSWSPRRNKNRAPVDPIVESKARSGKRNLQLAGEEREDLNSDVGVISPEPMDVSSSVSIFETSSSIPERPFQRFASPMAERPKQDKTEVPFVEREVDFPHGTQPFQSAEAQKSTEIASSAVSESVITIPSTITQLSPNALVDTPEIIGPGDVTVDDTASTSFQAALAEDKAHLKRALVESTLASQAGLHEPGSSGEKEMATDSQNGSQTSESDAFDVSGQKRKSRGRKSGSQSSVNSESELTAESGRRKYGGRRKSAAKAGEFNPEVLKSALVGDTQQTSENDTSQDESLKSRRKMTRRRSKPRRFCDDTEDTASTVTGFQGNANMVEMVEIPDSASARKDSQVMVREPGDKKVKIGVKVEEKEKKEGEEGEKKEEEEGTNVDLFSSDSDDNVPLSELGKSKTIDDRAIVLPITTERVVNNGQNSQSEMFECTPVTTQNKECSQKSAPFEPMDMGSDEADDDKPVTELFTSRKLSKKSKKKAASKNSLSDKENSGVIKCENTNEADDKKKIVTVNENVKKTRRKPRKSKVEGDSESDRVKNEVHPEMPEANAGSGDNGSDVTTAAAQGEKNLPRVTQGENSEEKYLPDENAENRTVDLKLEKLEGIPTSPRSSPRQNRKRKLKCSPEEILRKKLNINMKISPTRRYRSLSTRRGKPVRFHRLSLDRLQPKRGARKSLAKRNSQQLAEKQMEFVLSECVGSGRDFESEYHVKQVTDSKADSNFIGNNDGNEADTVLPGINGNAGNTSGIPTNVAAEENELDSDYPEDAKEPAVAPVADDRSYKPACSNAESRDKSDQSEKQCEQEITGTDKSTGSNDAVQTEGEADWSEEPMVIGGVCTKLPSDTGKDPEAKLFKSPLKVETGGKEQAGAGSTATSTATEALTVAASAATEAFPVQTSTSSPLKASFDIPTTPTSIHKHLTMSRAFRMLHQAHLSRKGIQRLPGVNSEPRAGPISRKPILKRSPLKMSPVKLLPGQESAVRGSPPPSSFRPINLPRLYSPRASPSAGILKRRRLASDCPVDSPSPPNKQRRVSFADSVEMKVIEHARSSRLVGRPSSPRPKPARCLNLPKKGPSPLATDQKVTEGTTKASEEGADEIATPATSEGTSDSAASTQESQLNCTNPVFPSLLECSSPVDQVLPQLTSSVWSRGLGQLIRSKNITTVGDLCALTEYDVHNLPIRSPKVANMKKVLQKFAQKVDRAEKTHSDIGDILDSSIESERGSETSGDLLDEIKRLDDDTVNGDPESVLPGASTELTNQRQVGEVDPESVLQGASTELTNQRQAGERDPESTTRTAGSNSESDKCADSKTRSPSYRKEISDQLKVLRGLIDSDQFSSVSTHALVGIQAELNEMMAKVNMQLSAKCPRSPDGSQIAN